MKYTKDNHRLNVKFIDGNTNELLFNVNDKNWMEIGEFFTDHYVDQLVKRTFGDSLPENVIVLVSAQYNLS